MNSGLSQNRFGHDRYRFTRHRAQQSSLVVCRHERNLWNQRQKGIPVSSLSRKRQRTRRSSVKGFLERDGVLWAALRVCQGPDSFDRALHSFGSAIAEEPFVQPAPFREFSGQKPLISVGVKIGGLKAALHLI